MKKQSMRIYQKKDTNVPDSQPEESFQRLYLENDKLRSKLISLNQHLENVNLMINPLMIQNVSLHIRYLWNLTKMNYEILIYHGTAGTRDQLIDLIRYGFELEKISPSGWLGLGAYFWQESKSWAENWINYRTKNQKNGDKSDQKPLLAIIFECRTKIFRCLNLADHQTQKDVGNILKIFQTLNFFKQFMEDIPSNYNFERFRDCAFFSLLEFVSNPSNLQDRTAMIRAPIQTKKKRSQTPEGVEFFDYLSNIHHFFTMSYLNARKGRFQIPMKKVYILKRNSEGNGWDISGSIDSTQLTRDSWEQLIPVE